MSVPLKFPQNGEISLFLQCSKKEGTVLGVPKQTFYFGQQITKNFSSDFGLQIVNYPVILRSLPKLFIFPLNLSEIIAVMYGLLHNSSIVIVQKARN